MKRLTGKTAESAAWKAYHEEPEALKDMDFEYREYAICSACGFMKFCRRDGQNFFCKSYDSDPDNDRKWKKKPPSLGDFLKTSNTRKIRKKRI